jgi:hypothetical protein
VCEGIKEKRPKSNWAQIISAAVGSIAIMAVGTQVYLISKNSKESAARQVYMSYSEAALRHPEFVEPDLPKIKANATEYVRYKSFFSHMLFAYDEILEVYDMPEWRKSFEIDMNYHMTYLCNDMHLADDMSFFKQMRMLLAETRAKCPNAVPKT